MVARCSFGGNISASFLLCMVCISVQVAQIESSEAALQQGASAVLSEIRDAHGDFSVVILPSLIPDVALGLPARIEFAKGLALLLEKSGVRSAEVYQEDFNPKSVSTTDLDALAQALSKFVRQKSISGDYVYATVFCGRSDSGATAILTVVADRDGGIVWKKRQGPEDSDFQQVAPKSPLEAAFVSFEPFRREIGLADPTDENATAGRWDDYFEQKRKMAMGIHGEVKYRALKLAGLVITAVVLGILLMQRARAKGTS